MSSSSSSSITLSAPSNTDIWRKPPTTNRFNAPTSANPVRGPLKKFQSAQITFSFTPTTQYDQAGLLLHLNKAGQPCHHSALSASSSGSGDGNNSSSTGISTDSKLHSSCRWLKTGVEFYEGEALVSTVGCDAYADWSVLPLAATDPGYAAAGTKSEVKDVTILAKREKDENGKGLWVYQVVQGKHVPLREVAWLFAHEDEGWEVECAAYACRPKEAQGELQAEIGALEISFGSS